MNEERDQELADTLLEMIPGDLAATLNVTRIDGGWCLKMAANGTHCIDVIAMAFNWRVMLSPIDAPGPHRVADAAWCYFGHGNTPEGRPRTMSTALAVAVLAVAAWDGEGDPAGYNKRAFPDPYTREP
ncbi:hypothetical protein MUG78_16960 [Gordonia alkaliphila]|uniref:hypothetical protein n=1 Tax=Gordonia alkaliphila TaxID=1053547 RepID=UPI001FF43C60|nr:hypothetical protein [Gordonia alkaliphila]MCK0441092.1 hypothetical protein [Gordonia alkaliphila]